MSDPLSGIFGAVIAASDLPGAACARRWDIWDNVGDPE